jgi:two-component system sensor histidine kinase/response regulator
MNTDSVQATVMIVDDEPDNLNVLEASLTRAGYRAVLFPRGAMAVAAAQAEPPDLVLLDVCMPEMDGYEVCRRFKADEALSQIPIIFISALTATEDIARGFECGGVDYIAKPFREPEVLARVRTHIAMLRAYAQLAEQYAQLRNLERHRDTLVHMVVHDMRSPLFVLLGNLEMIDRYGSQKLGADNLQSLRAAIHGAKVLSRMVSTVVDVSRLESVDIPFRRVAVSARELFEAALSQALDSDRRGHVSQRIAEDCPAVLCDVDLSTRIVANLLANALKYAPDSSEIELGAEPDPRGVRLWVRDTGPGISPQYHQRIFEKFGVAEAPIGQPPPSSGLGLAFCKMAVTAQGGTIGLESTPGQGSTFWFILPADGVGVGTGDDGQAVDSIIRQPER